MKEPAPAQLVERASPTPALSVEGVGMRYGQRAALRDVSLEVRSGEVVAVIGPNGAGKTTLLSIVAGIQRPSDGRVVVHGGKVGWVPQRAAVYGKLSVAENLFLFARLEGLADPAGAVAQMLELTGLQDRADEQLARLSGGNRQRVNVAIGLLGKPAALALDEPSAALDPRQRDRLWTTIRALACAGTAVLFSTHDVAEAAREASRVLVLADGEALFFGDAEELARAAGGDPGDLEAAFVRFLRDRGH